MPGFTPEDLLRFLYHETSITEADAIKTALENDWSLQEKYHVLKTATDRLTKIIEAPEKKRVDAILAYANAQLHGSLLHN